MKLRNRILIALASAVFLLGCQAPGDRTHTSAPNMGSSTGGGSFGDESSLTILRWAAKDLSQQILNSSPELYKNLPTGWTQARLAAVIANVEPTVKNQESYKIPEVSRHGQRLMFDYGKKADGTEYITATRLFTDAYASYDVNSRPKQDFYHTLEEVKLKLAHEAAHLMGLGLTKESDLTEARKFSRALFESLDSDNFECLPKNAPPIEVYPPFKAQLSTDPESVAEILKKSTVAYVFNRPTGHAATPFGIVGICPSATPFDNPAVKCREEDSYTSSMMDVFAPKSYTERFWIPSVRKSINEGIREYGNKDGYFSWNLIDRRKSVLTDEGYRSNYKYEKQPDMNIQFGDYLDFFIKQSSTESLVLESYPPLQQENWTYYRSQGKAQIHLQFVSGNIVSANLIILKGFNHWLEKTAPNDVHIVVPLKCVRSFKPLPVDVVQSRKTGQI